MWNYRIWKYSDEKEILIINDSKAGHLRQSQAAAYLLAEVLSQKGIKAKISTVEVRLKSRLSKIILAAATLFSGTYSCQRSAVGLGIALEKYSRQALRKISPDFVISCGSFGSMVNRMVSRENLSKSIAILKPAFAGYNKFDLVVMPEHDRPSKRKNTIVVQGALNLINNDYLKDQAVRLTRAKGEGLSDKVKNLSIGLLIGGDTKNFTLAKDAVAQMVGKVKEAAQALNADILVTTSRRTAAEIEELVKKEFSGYARCKLLVIANEKNIPEAVGAILDASDIIIVSPESVSMVSEAASSGKYVIVFDVAVDKKHKRFLENMADKKYIYLSPAFDIGAKIEFLIKHKPRIEVLNDTDTLKQALAGVI